MTRRDHTQFAKSQRVTAQKAVTPHVPEGAVHLMPDQMKPPEVSDPFIDI